MSSLFKQQLSSSSSSTSLITPGKDAIILRNKKIIEILRNLAIIEKNKGEPYKAKAYRLAVQSLERNIEKDISSGEEAAKLEGIGKKIAKKIDEILQSGKLEKLDKELGDSTTMALNELTRITGIGPSLAKKLVQEYSVKSINDLKIAVSQKKVKLNHHQQIGLKYHEEFEKRLAREEIQLIEQLIREQICQFIDMNIVMTVCGSYRRKLPSSGDIDILITQKESSSKCTEEYTVLQKVVEQLEKSNIVTDRIALGPTKFAGVCKIPDSIRQFTPHIHHRLDIRFVCSDQYYCALLYYTGSDFFNNQMRIRANELGYHLNEYNLCKLIKQGDKKIPDLEHPLSIASEKDVFDCLKMPYKSPEERSL